MYKEGDIADGPNGPLVYSNGKWRPLSASPQAVTLGRPNPAKQKADDLSNIIKQLEIDAKKQEMADRNQPKLPAGMRWKDGIVGGVAEQIPGVPQTDSGSKLTAKERSDAITKYRAALAMGPMIDRLVELYANGPGATQGVAGIRDYFGSPANQTFDESANKFRGTLKKALGMTGGENNTAAEGAQNLGGYLPQSSNFDSNIEEKFASLRDLQRQSAQEAIAVLGGVPDQNGNITPLAEGQDPIGGIQRSAQVGAQYSGASLPTTLATGKKKAIAINPNLQADYNAFLKANPRGSLPPEDYATFRLKLDAQYGYPVQKGDYERYYKEGKAYNEDLKRPFNTTIPPIEGQTTQAERDKAASFVGDIWSARSKAAGARFADKMGMGIPSALVGQDVMGGIQQAQPGASLAGDVTGALVGTWGLNKLGAETVGKVAPKLVTNSGFLRNLIGDTAYGAIYKGVAEGDPLGGAVESAAGSAGGQIAGKAVGATLKGVTAPAQTMLRNAGVPLTVGQSVRNSGPVGRFVAGVEDLTANAGPLGSMVQARRLEGLDAANRAAFNIGANGKGVVTEIGGAGVDQLGHIKNQAYNEALNPVALTPDAQFGTQYAAADAAGRSVDAARGRGDFGYIMDNQVGPLITPNAPINGRQLQDVLRTTQARQRAYIRAANGPQPDPMAEGVGDALGAVNDAFTGLTARQAPSVIPKLKEANQINRNFLILDDAANANTDGMFTGAGLNAAVRRNVRGLFGRSSKAMVDKQPLAKFAQAMHEVLPNQIPQTGVNAAPTLALLGGLGLGGGAGAMAGDAKEGAGYGLTLGALTTLASTKQGQKMIVSALMDRPDAARFIGSKVGQHSGLLGMAGSGYLLGNQ